MNLISNTYNHLRQKMVLLWKSTKQNPRFRNFLAILRNTNRNWLHSDLKKANIFANHLADTFQPHNTIILNKINTVEQCLNSLLQMCLPLKHISSAEIRNIQYTKFRGKMS